MTVLFPVDRTFFDCSEFVMDYLVVTVLLLSFQNQIFVWGDYELRVRLHQYENPSHRVASGSCCDYVFFFTCGQCDTIFQFCLRPENFNPHVLSCPLGDQYAVEVGGDRIVFDVDGSVGSISNPVTFQNSGAWPGSFQLLIDIHDSDLLYNDFIDSIFIQPHLPLVPDQPFTEPLGYTGTHRRGRITASFQVVCQRDYFRPDCSVFCQETDQNYCDDNGDRICKENHYPPECVLCEASTFYDCDSNGNIVCKDNFYNPPTCETLCIPMDDDIQGHYTCNLDGSRKCMDSYYGENCTLFCEAVTEQYSCDEEGEKVCADGFYGAACDVYCMESDDEFGHFNCSETGDKICLFGFHNSTTNCTQQICDPACELVGGFCNATSALCACFDGWRGQRCSECIPTEGCSIEGGYCIVPGQCLCRVGFNGSLCETEVDPCLSNPCKNRGTCANLEIGFQCQCTAGFTGSLCEDIAEEVPGAIIPGSLKDSNGLSEKSIVGIVVGVLSFVVIAVFIAIATLLYLVWRKKKNDRIMHEMYRTAADEGISNPSYTPQTTGDHIMSSGSTGNGSMLNEFENPLYHDQDAAYYSQPAAEDNDLDGSYHSEGMYSTIDHRPERRSRGLRQSLLEPVSSASNSSSGRNNEDENVRHQQRPGLTSIAVPEEEILYVGAGYSLLTTPEET